VFFTLCFSLLLRNCSAHVMGRRTKFRPPGKRGLGATWSTDELQDGNERK
jgi:hypothetical protein